LVKDSNKKGKKTKYQLEQIIDAGRFNIVSYNIDRKKMNKSNNQNKKIDTRRFNKVSYNID
jgi:hypothetical protein